MQCVNTYLFVISYIGKVSGTSVKRVHPLSSSISSKQAACFSEKYLNYALWTKSKLYFPKTHIFCLNSVDLKVSWVHMICCSMGSTAIWGSTYNSYCVTETPLLVNKNCGKHIDRIIDRLQGRFLSRVGDSFLLRLNRKVILSMSFYWDQLLVFFTAGPGLQWEMLLKVDN